MTWQFSLILFFIFSVTQALFQRHYSQKSNLPLSFPPALSYLFGVTPLGIIVGLVLPHHISWGLQAITLLVLEGVFIGLYNWLAFKAISKLPVAQFETIFQLYSIVVVTLGWTLLQEKLTGFQIIGGVLLLFAAILAANAPKTRDNMRLTQNAIGLAALAALTMGIGLVAEKAALNYMDIGAYFIVGYLTQTIAIIVIASKDASRVTIRSIGAYDIRRSLTMGVLSAVVGFFYIYAIVQSNNVSLIAAISALVLPLIAITGYIVLRERENVKLLIATAILASVGLIIMAI